MREVWAEPVECALCGRTGAGIERALVHWIEALPGMSWAHVPRCTDRPACRARVEGSGQSWPLVETDR